MQTLKYVSIFSRFLRDALLVDFALVYSALHTFGLLGSPACNFKLIFLVFFFFFLEVGTP